MSSIVGIRRKRILPDPENQNFINEALRLESCLQRGQEATRRLPFGCLLQASRPSRGITKTILRVFLDPLHFKKWTSNIEPIEMLYMNPCGIELVKSSRGKWGIYLAGEELLLNLSEPNPYEIAHLEIEDSIVGGKEITRIK